MAELCDAAFLARLEHLDIAIRRLAQGVQGGDKTVARRGSGMLFREHRAYSTGDDPRRLDWNVYLRLGELLIKEHEAEEAPRLLLVLDRSASMAIGTTPKFAVARELVECMAAIALLRRVWVTCTESPACIEPASFTGRAALMPMLQRMRRIAPITAGASAAAVAAVPVRRTGLAVCFTDLFDDSLDALVRSLTGHGAEVHVLHLRDAGDASPPLGELVRLKDAESGEELVTRIDAAARSAWRATLEAHFVQRSARLSALGATVTPVDIAAGAESILMQLAQRGTLVH